MNIPPLAQPFLLPGGRQGILIIHGLGGSVAEYRPYAEALQKSGLTVSGALVAGHGQDMATLAATKPADWYASVEQAWHELQQQCDHVIIVGASYGGMLGIALAARHPEIQGLVLINPAVSYRGGGSWQDLVLRLYKIFRPYYQKPGLSQADLERYKETGSLPGWPIQSLLDSKNYAQSTIMPLLPRVTCPMLVLVSSQDRYVNPADVQRVFQGRSRTTLKNIPSRSHRPFRERETLPWLIEQTQDFARGLETKQ